MAFSIWADRLAGLGGIQRMGLALLLGALLALAQAPVFAWPLLLPCFGGLWLLTRDSGCGRVYFATVFAFAYGYFVAGLYWIGIAFFVDAERFALLVPLPVLGLPLLLALFPAGGAWAARYLGGGAEPWRLVLFAGGWTLGEWLRSVVLTGFPWNLIGYVWADQIWMMQLAAWIGSHGLGLVTLLLVALALLPLVAPGRGRRAAWLAPVLLVGIMGAGAWRIAATETENMPGIWLRLVQPSVPQSLKWRDDLRQQHLMQHVELTRQPGRQPATHVIWPETAVPYLLDEMPDLLRGLGHLLPPGGQLFTGAPRREFDARQQPVIYNSILVVNAEGGLDGRYDKIHLVPFGEYMPFRALLAPFGLDKFAVGGLDFSPGRDAEPMILPGDLPLVRALICYEAIFPNEVMDHAPPPAGMLLNLTNDAWFGTSSGPYQHFAAHRMRAVEQGVPLVRSANNGISALVDPLGRVIARLGLNDVGIVEGPLAAPLVERPPYSRTGDLPVLAVAALLLLAGFLVRKRQGRTPE